MIPTLNKSAVRFCENPHGYRLGDKMLSGITGLIHDVLKLGVYPEASEFVRNVAIPRAGEYGSSVHRAIELYDTLGITQTEFPKSPRFGENESDTHWHVAQELETYIRHKEGYTAVCNEYTVSDNEQYASNIDNVWLKESSGGIWLVDTKTNNLDYYPGGKDALKLYLSWQLSIYALLFERQNPGLKVEGLAANWLRKGDGEFWEIERQPGWKVVELLDVHWTQDAYGKIHYHPMPWVRERLLDNISTATWVAKTQDTELMAATAIDEAAELVRLSEEYAAKVKELKERLRTLMENSEIKSWDNERFRATIANDSVTSKFDTARFKKDHPDLYNEYVVKAEKKGGFTITLK